MRIKLLVLGSWGRFMIYQPLVYLMVDLIWWDFVTLSMPCSQWRVSAKDRNPNPRGKKKKKKGTFDFPKRRFDTKIDIFASVLCVKGSSSEPEN